MQQEKQREIVFPSQILGDLKTKKAGQGTFVENGKIIASKLGVLNSQSDYINVVPIKGAYEPVSNDFIIGVVEEALTSGWLVDINAPSPAFLHVNEVPWTVDFNDTEKYLNRGDCIMAKILSVDEQNKYQITLNDRNLYKIKGGNIIEVEPSRVSRIIGKKGSMISLIKNHIRCRVFVGQNGRIWIDGELEAIKKATEIIEKIEKESTSFGLTNRIETLLKNYSKGVQ